MTSFAKGFFSSSVGTKVAIALTGLALLGFLVLHLIGNLLAIIDPATFNAYSDRLVSNPLLIPAELGLAAIFLIHAYKTVRMWLANRQARPVAYSRKHRAGHTSRKSVASTTMIVTGVVTFAFLVLHLKTFKWGTYYEVPGTGGRDLYRLVVEVFSSPAYVALYVVCMGLVGLHLTHGVSSAFQSLGVDRPGLSRRLVTLGKIAAIVIGGGFALIPIYMYFYFSFAG